MALTKIKADGLTADLIDESKLADNSIDSEHYNDGSIDNAHLADDAVGVAELSATGTASSSTFLRGDNSWATPTDTNTVTTINNNDDNKVITATGTANTLQGEPYLFNSGTSLSIGTTSPAYLANLHIRNSYSVMRIDSDGSNNDTKFYNVTGTGKNNYIYFGDAADDDVGQIAYDHNGDHMKFTVGASERMRINTTGVGINTTSPAHKLHVEDSVSNVIVAKQTTNNGGYNTFAGVDSFGNVKFYASHNGRVGASDGIIFGSDTASANVLDDYEEGTYTISDASGNGITYTANSTTKYVKIGQLVFVQFDVTLTNCNNSTTQDSRFTLPFALAHDYGSGVVGWNDLDRQVTLHVASGGAFLMDNSQTGNASRHLKNSELNNERFIGNFHYLAAT